MSDWSNIVYMYDGSFEGFLCCVFESYEKKEIPADIFSPNEEQTILVPLKEIITDMQKSKRVLESIPQKICMNALELVRYAFLTCLPGKELYILKFLRMGYHYGPSVLNMLTNDVVNTLNKAVKHLTGEAHLLKGFVRFSVFSQVLVAEIEPKNYVLPLLTQHFCERYPEESFLIFDKTHSMALVYKPYKYSIIHLEDLKVPSPDEKEMTYRNLWKLFYDTIEIEGRHNPKCRMSHMPKRYWKCMTEFGDKGNEIALIEDSKKAKKLLNQIE